MATTSEWRMFVDKYGLWIAAALVLAYLLSFLSRPLADLSNPENPDETLYRADVIGILVRTPPSTYWEGWTTGGLSGSTLIERIPVVGLAIVITSIAGVLGWLALQAIGWGTRFSRLERGVIAVAVGWQLHSLIILFLGLVGLLSILGLGLGYGGTASLLVIVRRMTRNRALDDSPERLETHSTQTGRSASNYESVLSRVSVFGCVLFATLIIAGAVLPPIDFDVKEYHLQIPKEWYLDGRIGFVEHNVYGNMPLAAESHSIAAMILSPVEPTWWWGALAGKLVMAFHALAAALLLYCGGRRWLSPAAGGVAALVYLSTPWVIKMANIGKNENAFGFYLVASMYCVMCLVCSRRLHDVKSNWKELAVAGFLAGGAVSIKYPAVLFVCLPGAGLLALAPWLERRSWWKKLPHLSSEAQLDDQVARKSSSTKAPAPKFAWQATLMFAVCALVSCAPWFGKNLVLSGNPTYPLLGDLFGTRSAEQNEQWRQAHSMTDDGGYSPVRLFRDAEHAVVGSQWLSPALFPLAVIGLFQPTTRRLAILIGGMLVCVFVVWWCFTHRIERFLVPAYPLVALLAGWGVIGSASTGWRIIGASTLAIGVSLSFLIAIAPPPPKELPPESLLGDHRFLSSYEELAEPRLQVDRMHRLIDEHVEPGNAVLLVGDAAPFDLRTRALYNTCFDECQMELLLANRSPGEQLAALRELRISHVFVSWSELRRYRQPGSYGYSDYPTEERFHELVASGVLIPVAADVSPGFGQLYRVAEEHLKAGDVD